MVKQALQWTKQHGFSFLITGEVLGQRPMSQRKDTLPIIAKDTENLLLRPLSAKLLPLTLPEKAGWVNRELLYAFNGRSRKPQIELAEQFGFNEYPQPAGGCILTDAIYTRRLKDWWRQNGNKDYTLDDIMLLQVGRHLRFHPDFKIIVGRDKLENEFLEKFQDRYMGIHSISHIGPNVLCVGKVDVNLLTLVGVSLDMEPKPTNLIWFS